MADLEIKDEAGDETPEIAARMPAVLELDAGRHFWCVCGRSTRQPFCDGSHKGTSFRPMRFDLDEPKRVALCQCKHTAGPPYCDGAHKDLPVEADGGDESE